MAKSNLQIICMKNTTTEMKGNSPGKKNDQAKNSLMGLLKPYLKWIVLLIFLAFLSNGINLTIPRLIANGIDAFNQKTLNLDQLIITFLVSASAIFIFTYSQSIVQTYTSELVARDLRKRLSEKISNQSYASVQDMTPSRLLTNLTSDIDAVKMFVAQAMVSIASSIFLIIGASTLLVLINWKLALSVLVILPVIGLSFFYIFSQVRILFKKTQEIIDKLNKVINENILGSALIRVINSQQQEYEKFFNVNFEAQTNSFRILKLFAALIPVISFVASIAVLIILVFGGHLVIVGEMTLGQLAAFNSYLSILIFPIMIIGFMSNVMARAGASYQRIAEVLGQVENEKKGTIREVLKGKIELVNVSLVFGGKTVLKNISFTILPGQRIAIIGPTAAGKTQLLNLLIGLTAPTSGEIILDSHPLQTYEKKSLHQQIGIVFQDSVLFNLSLRENISFHPDATSDGLEKAIVTAELKDFIESLPEQLDTIVSERGTSLSGGQKQRVMLARALALNPKILLLDDFTARVDTNTERRILDNVHQNFPGITLISVTQKISSIESYDQIIVLMEGELLAIGTHQKLMETSPDYVQIFNSQRSTSHYELQS